MSNILINGLTAVHAGSNGTLTTVDVCKTPPLCVPIPYTNIAKSSDAAKTASSIKINGNPACNLTSNFAVSSGDEAGTCGGVVSGTIKGMAEFITGSPNVFFEGIPAVRQSDLMVSNNKNTVPSTLMQPGVGKPPEISDESPEELEASETHKYGISTNGNDLSMQKGLFDITDE
ncbi:MAG: DUF4150 domain-containing protein [Thiohalomonadales bacterium]